MVNKSLHTCILALLMLYGGVSEELTPDTANSVTTEAFQEAIDVPDFAVLRNNFVVPPEENSSGEKKRGSCICAVFDDRDGANTNSQPIFTHPTIEVDCNKGGQQRCNNICTFAARSVRRIGASFICAILGHVDGVKVSVYSKTCNAPDYIFTGIADTNPICCHEGLVTRCGRKKDLAGHICHH